MSIGGKTGRDDIPGKQHCDTEERKDAENDWCCPASAIETPIHNKSLAGAALSYRKLSRMPALIVVDHPSRPDFG